MNPLLILAAIVVIATVLKPASLNKSVDNSTYSPAANTSSVESSASNSNVIIEKRSNLSLPLQKTPLFVSGVSDKTNRYEDNGVGEGESRGVSREATEMLIDALLRSGQCEIVNQEDSAKYFVRGVITEYGCEVITKEGASGIEGKEDPIKYARARAAIDLRITDAATAEIIKTVSMRDEIIGKWVESNVFSFSEGEISYEVRMEDLEQQAIDMVLSCLINSMVDELVKSGIFKVNPLFIITVEGVQQHWAEETSLYLVSKLLKNNIDVTLEIIPCNEYGALKNSSNLVRMLKKLYRKYPDKIEFALQGFRHEKQELNTFLEEQVRILSRAQNVFAQAFNKKSDKNKIFPTSLVPPYMHYNKETFLAAKLAGLKVIIGCEFQKDDQGFALWEDNIIEIKPDEEGNLVNDWAQKR